MRVLFFVSWMFLLLAVVACQQSTAKKKAADLGGSSPSSSIENRNSRFDAGKLVYDRNCKVCHQVNRMGIPRVYPPLKNTKHIKGDKEYLIGVVLNGLSGEMVVEGEVYNGVMASYRNLSDQQIADVLNYIRSDSEAAGDMVRVEEVKEKR